MSDLEHTGASSEQTPKPTLEPGSAELAERAVHRRAVEAVIWGMPAVNFELLHQAMVKAGGAFNQIVYWSRPPDWRNQTLTPNPDTIYVFPFFNTREVGPVVLEIPPAEGGSITGSIMDAWQAALEDVGPAGADLGKGGKYVILPPGWTGETPVGCIALASDTYAGYAVLRSNLAGGTDADIAAAVAYGKQVRVYPLSQAAAPPQTTFVDAADTVYDNTIPYDLRFFEALHRFVQAEPWLERDKAMIDQLRSVGIEQGRPFNPDAKVTAILEDAAREAHAWLEARYETVFTPPYFGEGQWAVPVSQDVIEGQANLFAEPDVYPLDARGVLFSMAYFSAKHLGAGQFYVMTIRDGDGQPLRGGETYRLHVPSDVPATLYWSATAYDRATHALIKDLPWASRSSITPDLQKNADGSVDLWFGPKASSGAEANWIPTRASGDFEVLFRFYGPEPPLFDKSWKLPDIERRALH